MSIHRSIPNRPPSPLARRRCLSRGLALGLALVFGGLLSARADGATGEWVNVPAEYPLGSGPDLVFALGPGAPPVGEVLFQTWSNVTEAVEAPDHDATRPYVYPADALAGVPPGAGEVQALVRAPDGTLIDTVSQRVMFVVGSTCLGDLSHDGNVDALDLMYFLMRWGSSDIEADFNRDGVVDAYDLVILSTNWGACECDDPESDRDGDGTPDCLDGCPDDPNKQEPGHCGCGVPETEDCEPPGCIGDLNGDGWVDDTDVELLMAVWGTSDPLGDLNEDGVVDVEDLIILGSNWGECGCPDPRADRDGDGTPDCEDRCPDDPNKTEPGRCGCGQPEEPDCGGRSGGWTEFVESPDTRVIYVSRSQGNDSNDGLSSSRPVRTIARGRELLRDGYPDWLLLRRGDTWPEPFGRLDIGGRSADAPMLISCFGDPALPRPELVGGDNTVFIWGADRPRFIAFVSLSIRPGANGFELLTDGRRDLLIEDCRIEAGRSGILIQPPDGTTVDGITIRRNVIVDCGLGEDTLAHGIKSARTVDLLIEENVIDHNGSSPTHEHDLYISSGVNTIIRNNIVTRASNNGLKFRGPHTNGLIEGNVLSHDRNGMPVNCKNRGEMNLDIQVIDNALLNIGVEGQHLGILIGATHQVTIANNLLVNAPEDWLFPVISFGFAQNYDGGSGWPHPEDVVLRNNTIYHWASTALEWADGLPYENVTVERNIMQSGDEYLVRHWDWLIQNEITYADNVYRSERSADRWFRNNNENRTLSVWMTEARESTARDIAVRFRDPGRSLASYNASLGGQASFEAFIAEARKQEKANWREAYTAQAVIAYLREGFTPVDLGYPQEGFYGAVEY